MKGLKQYDPYSGEKIDRGNSTLDDHTRLWLGRLVKVIWHTFAAAGVISIGLLLLFIFGVHLLFTHLS